MPKILGKIIGWNSSKYFWIFNFFPKLSKYYVRSQIGNTVQTNKLLGADTSPQPIETKQKTFVYSSFCFCFVFANLHIIGQLFVPYYAADYQNKIFGSFYSSNPSYV